MKSTQDLHIWLNQVAGLLNKSLLSMEVFSDKSFRIYSYVSEAQDTVLLYDSSEQPENLDSNDVAYIVPADFVKLLRASVVDTPLTPS